MPSRPTFGARGHRFLHGNTNSFGSLEIRSELPAGELSNIRRKHTRPIYLDLAYPEFKICIEYEGSHHAGQWLNDARRRQMIEDAGWKYIQVTKLDIGDEAGEEALARRVAERIQEVTGKTVQLTMRQTTQQISDVRKLRRIPLYKRLKFEPLLPIIPTTQE